MPTTCRLLLFLVALCLSAAAQPSKEQAKAFEPDAAQRAEAARLRGALAAAVGEHFEVARDRLTRRSNWHGGGTYWLAHLRARRPGGFQLGYRYRYNDRVNPHDPLYTFVEHKTFVNVGPVGCARRPRSNSVCVGDTVILPVVFNDYTEHTFQLEAQPYAPADAATEKSLREMEDGSLHREPVHNPAGEFMRYVGRRVYYSPHRAPGYTMTFHATFEAVKPGAFNLAVTMPASADAADGPKTLAETAGARAVPVVVVAPGTPITVISSGDNVHGYTERFSSSGGGNSYRTTPVILQVGERLTLEYLKYSRRGLSARGEKEEALEATVKQQAPAITLLPFYVDPALDFNEWLVEFLPPSRRE